MIWKSTFEHAPPEPGWYAILVCYDAGEGFFPSGGYWDGEKWDERGVSYFGDSAPNVQDAVNLAIKNDPGW